MNNRKDRIDITYPDASNDKKASIDFYNNTLPTTEDQQILRSLDDQKFSWYHVKAILVSGVG